MKSAILAIIVFLALGVAPSHGAVNLRGVAPEKLPHYSSKFMCLSDKLRIPSSRVNDNYCDCADGSDEPGTSACSSVDAEAKNFYCPNAMHKPLFIYQSHVDDGVCDCCDGSDESGVGVVCVNTCATAAAAHDAESVLREERRQLGLAAKADLLTRAVIIRSTKVEELRLLQMTVSVLTAESLPLEENKKREEAVEAVEREDIHQTSLKKKQEYESPRPVVVGLVEEEVAAPAALIALPLPCVSWRQSGTCSPDDRSFPEESSCEVLIDTDASGHCECENSDSLGDLFTRFSFECGHPRLTCKNVCRYRGLPVTPESDEARTKEFLDLELYKVDDGSSHERAEAKNAREAFRLKTTEKTEAERKVTDLEKELKEEYGTGDAFLALRGECFTSDGTKDYTYTLCVYKDVVQKKSNGGGTSNLGRWKSFAEKTYSSWGGTKDTTKANYDGGDSCWSGPTRSTTVFNVCGPTNAVLDVKEPSMCTYTMTFQTPAVCE